MNMIITRYAGRCKGCATHIIRGTVAAHAGRGQTYCLACAADREASPDIIVTRFSSGETVYRNRAGRCEDAPCCGCCS